MSLARNTTPTLKASVQRRHRCSSAEQLTKAANAKIQVTLQNSSPRYIGEGSESRQSAKLGVSSREIKRRKVRSDWGSRSTGMVDGICSS